MLTPSTISSLKTDDNDDNADDKPDEETEKLEHTLTLIPEPEIIFLPRPRSCSSDTQDVRSEDEKAFIDFSIKEENDPLDETLPELKATLEEEDEDDVATGLSLTSYQLRKRPSLQVAVEGSSDSSSCSEED